MRMKSCGSLLCICLCRLDRHSGQLFVNGHIVADEYNFRVKVYDVTRMSEVISTVTVHVKEISDEAVLNSGSVRLQGLFVGPRPMSYCFV